MTEILGVGSQLFYLGGFLYCAYCIVRHGGAGAGFHAEQFRDCGPGAQSAEQAWGAYELSYYV